MRAEIYSTHIYTGTKVTSRPASQFALQSTLPASARGVNHTGPDFDLPACPKDAILAKKRKTHTFVSAGGEESSEHAGSGSVQQLSAAPSLASSDAADSRRERRVSRRQAFCEDFTYYQLRQLAVSAGEGEEQQLAGAALQAGSADFGFPSTQAARGEPGGALAVTVNAQED